MMPELDGFGLLAGAARRPRRRADIPVVMLSARAGEEATVEGLEAGADDYLVKPFTARELLARVRANLELDRARRMRDAARAQPGAARPGRSGSPRVGSWEIDLATSEVTRLGPVPAPARRSTRRGAARGRPRGRADVRPPRRPRARRGPRIEDAVEPARRSTSSAARPARRPERASSARCGELDRDEDGRPARAARQRRRTSPSSARPSRRSPPPPPTREAAAREHRIADELQRSLLPAVASTPEHLELATYYRAGVEGTQVGGDWYDVIELGAGRTALVIGDVMGRGVRAAAVMGQLRAAVRAYARLDLPPGRHARAPRRRRPRPRRGPDRHLRLRDLRPDATARSSTPTPATCRRCWPSPTAPPRRLDGPRAAARQRRRSTSPSTRCGCPTAALLALYTDGLVERRARRRRRRHRRARRGAPGARAGRIESLPGALVDALLPEGPDDDVAVLVARVPPAGAGGWSATLAIAPEARSIGEARDFVAAALRAARRRRRGRAPGRAARRASS